MRVSEIRAVLLVFLWTWVRSLTGHRKQPLKRRNVGMEMEKAHVSTVMFWVLPLLLSIAQLAGDRS